MKTRPVCRDRRGLKDPRGRKAFLEFKVLPGRRDLKDRQDRKAPRETRDRKEQRAHKDKREIRGLSERKGLRGRAGSTDRKDSRAYQAWA